MQGDLNGAEDIIRRAVAFGSDDGASHFLLGAVLLRRGSLDDAEQAFRIAIDRGVRDVTPAYNYIANILVVKGDGDGAIRMLREVIGLNADYAEAHDCAYKRGASAPGPTDKGEEGSRRR